MPTLEDRVVAAILEEFHALSSKSKPRTLTSGIQEWVPLSGIVAIGDNDTITCLALGTGMKCLPSSKSSLLESGTVLHDWHAEILAIRAFNHFLLQECHRLASCTNYKSPIIRCRQARNMSEARDTQPFGIDEGLRIMMYCSEAPCGDASMELVMEAQQDPTPWPVAIPDEQATSSLLGRGSFSQLGIVRRKPCEYSHPRILSTTNTIHEKARGDSPVTLSKSCSDKFALKQCMSLLSSPLSLLISPDNAYIDTLILPRDQYRQQACERAFGPSGRMLPVVGSNWPGNYNFRPFRIETTEITFHFSRRAAGTNVDGFKGSNISAVWTLSHQETLINGVLQGRKQTDRMGASALSRVQIWNLLLQTANLLDIPSLNSSLGVSSYIDMKLSQGLKHRRLVKNNVKNDALKGWNS